MDDKKQQTKRFFVNDVDGYSSKHIAKVKVEQGENAHTNKATYQSVVCSNFSELLEKFLAACEAGDPSEGGDTEETLSSPGDEPAFQVVGTVSSSSDEFHFLHEHYESPTREELLKHLLDCDVVVYNISETSTQQQVDEATWAITALHAKMETFKSRKMFILVSTVMTWALTKPKEPDNAEAIFSEEEFRSRRPHPSFRNHNDLEKLVLKLTKGKKSKLTGYVIAAGLQYGMEQNLFHYFFKISWLLEVPKVPIFGDGTNYIPMIHVYDLGGVIQNIIEMRPKSKYILAVDDSKNTLEDIVKKISGVLGPEKVHKMSLQDAITMEAFKPGELDCLRINLRLDAIVVNDTFNLHWTCQSGMVEKMENIVQEYKDSRQLFPVKICLLGPPAVGKSTVSEKLCQHYKIHHIHIKGIVEEKITQLTKIINGVDPENDSEEIAAAQKLMENINKSLEKYRGRLAEHQIFDILQEKLNSKPCRNHGFVLDGFPKTYEQARMIFSAKEPENKDTVLMSLVPWYNKTITPEYVFALDASDDFLTSRVQRLPERVAEDEFVPRLERYRQLRRAEETVLDFFDHREIHPEHIDVSTDDSECTDVMKKVIEIVGVPKNYGPSPEEQEEENQRREDERRQKLAAEAVERKRRKAAALAEMSAQYEEWQKNLAEVRRQERELLEAQALPLRNYLMKHVMPSLNEAMSECCKIKPEDPVDFLAEHLLHSNQQK